MIADPKRFVAALLEDDDWPGPDVAHNRDWARRRNLPVENDVVTAYHATPNKTARILRREGLRAGSYLAADPEKAAFQCTRDRDLRPDQVTVFAVQVPMDAFYGGIWGQTTRPIPPESLTAVSR